jgi:hypothetical protein
MTNHLTPTRITPTHTSTAIFKGHPHVIGANGMSSTSTPTGVSPSPNSRRYAANAAGSVNNATWLEDPFDYQGALQHEFDAINQGAGGNNYMSRSGDQIVGFPGGIDNGLTGSPLRNGGGWQHAPQESAVRDQ